MMLFRQQNFIFLKTAKTAGTSFEIALSKFAGPDDIVTPVAPGDERLRAALGFRGPQNYLRPGREGRCDDDARFYNHSTAAEICRELGAAAFDGFLKVSIVRNPYELAVSRYFWEHRSGVTPSRDHFRTWLLGHPPRLLRNRTITHLDDRCVVDIMLRFEAFEQDIAAFAAKVGLPAALYDVFKSIRTKSRYRPPHASSEFMFEGFAAGTALIESLFAEDIRLYGYRIGA